MPSPDRSALIHQIREAEGRGETGYVVILCRKFLERFPEYGPALHSLGVAFIELARYDEAETVLLQALACCPIEQKLVVLSGLGHLEEARGNRPEARAWFIKAHEANPNNANSLVFLGCSFFQDGDHGQAEQAHQKAAQCSEGCIDEAYFNLGGVYLALDRFVEARKCYLKALEIDPAYGLAKERLGDVERILGAAF